MSVGTRVDSTQGPVTTNGTSGLSFERHANNKGFGPFQVDSVLALTSGSTLDAAACGVNTLSSTAILTQVLPKASNVPGATMIFRSLSAHAHILTGSLETAGNKVFLSQWSGSNGGWGSKLTLANLVGASVVLMSDGLNFHVMSFSGSVTIA